MGLFGFILVSYEIYVLNVPEFSIYVNSKLYLKTKSMKILTIFIVSYYLIWSIILQNVWSNKTIKKCDLFYLLNEMLKVKMFMTS